MCVGFLVFYGKDISGLENCRRHEVDIGDDLELLPPLNETEFNVPVTMHHSMMHGHQMEEPAEEEDEPLDQGFSLFSKVFFVCLLLSAIYLLRSQIFQQYLYLRQKCLPF